MPGKSQPQMQLHRSSRNRRSVLRPRFPFRFSDFRGLARFLRLASLRSLFWLRTLRRGLRCSCWHFACWPLKFVQQLLVQPKRLLPYVQLVPGQLGLLFVGSKIKTHVYVCHGCQSAWRMATSQGSHAQGCRKLAAQLVCLLAHARGSANTRISCSNNRTSQTDDSWP